jgi:hypothetical protein
VSFPPSQRCSGRNRFGEPCKAKAVKEGKCAMHAGITDPKAMGRAGGVEPKNTALRKAARADGILREKAKAVLGAALDGKDERRAFEAAKSLYSFRPEVPPADRREQQREHQVRGVFGIADLARLAGELHVFSQLGGMTLEAEKELVARLDEQQKRSYDSPPYPPEKETA